MLISNSDLENDFNVLYSKIENNSKRMSAIHSFLYNEAQCCCEEFNRERNTITKCFYQYEYETSAIASLLKVLFEKMTSVVNDNKDMLNEIGQLKESIGKLNDERNELKYQNDIIHSQGKYYKKQNLEKDNYIYELKTQIADMQSQFHPQSQFPSQLDKSSLNLSYKEYDEITLPQRIRRKASEDRLSKRPNSSMNINLNLSNITTDLNEERSKFNYESHINYGYDYKNDDLDSFFKKIDQSISAAKNSDVGYYNNSNKEENERVSNKGTITKRVRDVIMNLYKNDSTVNYLQKAFGNNIIQKLSSGNIDYATIDKVERIINKKNTESIKKDIELKEEIEKCLDSTKAKKSGWDRLKGYIKLRPNKNY